MRGPVFSYAAVVATAALFAVSGCNLSDDAPPTVGGSDNVDPNNNAADGGNNSTSPNNGTTGNNSTSPPNSTIQLCSGDDLSTCPALPNAEITECLEGVCIYQCEPGYYDTNQDLEAGGGDGCESDCEPTNEGVETCDGLDNDCNGVIDDGFGVGNTCSEGEGECAANGRFACLADGTDSYCEVEVGQPTTEVCDGLDNDCDGEIDEDNAGGGGSCETNQPGACLVGSLVCTASGELSCEPLNQAAADEDCGADDTGNGIDDDCNGMVDDGCSACPTGDIRDCYTGNSSTQNVGECQDGQQQCLNGGYQACLGETLPQTELCNAKDDDCDGDTDEGFNLGRNCTIGVGACKSSGMFVCAADEKDTVCNATVIQPTSESCNGVDDDCDGTTDEDFPNLGKTCSVGIGACRRNGTLVCTSDGVKTTCSATPGLPVRELCGDGVDNDCDGSVDEGCSGTSNCSPACRLGNQCCNDGRNWSCYSRPPIGALCEPSP